jgi:AAA domain
MVEALGVAPADIVAYNTDAIKVKGAYNADATKLKSDCSPGQYHVEGCAVLSGRTMAELDRFEPYIFSPTDLVVVSEDKLDLDRVINKGAMVTGMPGCGKTEFVKKIIGALSVEQRAKTAVLSYTNAAVENLRERSKDYDLSIMTLNGLLWNGKTLTTAPLASYERIILDEFIMLPPFEMSLLQKAHHEHGVVMICLGDPNQCKAPVNDWVRYDTNPAFISMCGGYEIRMKYKPGYARFDQALYQSLCDLMQTKKLDWDCNTVPSYQNICFTNDERHRINKECFERWVAEHDSTIVEFGFPVCVGLPVLVYEDADKKLGIYKTQKWTVKAVEDDKIYLTLKDREVYLDRKQFKKTFAYSFAMTAHKCQSMTIEGHYNIYEADRMKLDVLYTAMSRGRKREYVHLDAKCDGTYEPTSRRASVLFKPKPIELKTARIESKWQTGLRMWAKQSIPCKSDLKSTSQIQPTTPWLRVWTSMPPFTCWKSFDTRRKIRCLRLKSGTSHEPWPRVANC